MKIVKKRSDKGIIMVAVVAFIIVISVLILGIMSRNVSQAVSMEKQIQHMQAEQLGRGAFWAAHANLINGVGYSDFSTNIDGHLFNIQFNQSAGGGPGSTDIFNTTVSY